MKYFVVGLLAVIYIYAVWYVIQVNNQVRYQADIIKLGETYANETEESEHRELTKASSK